MPSYDPSTIKALAEVRLGVRVDRTAATHAAATTPYFTVVGGRVLMTMLVGKVTVASGANACSWVANPTAGTANQKVCGDLDINPAVIGDALTISGLAGDAMIYGTTAGLGAFGRSVVLNVGTLDFIAAAADGATSWSMWYVPLEDGAYVTAA
jgi:hypothetical protein